jgi:hypothetical protein
MAILRGFSILHGFSGKLGNQVVIRRRARKSKNAYNLAMSDYFKNQKYINLGSEILHPSSG